MTGKRSASPEIAVIDLSDPLGLTLTCRELDAGASAFAQDLSRRELSPGGAIGLIGDNSAKYLMAYMGVMRAGHVAVPINHRQPRSIIEYICHEAGLALVLVDRNCSELVPPGVEFALLESPEFSVNASADPFRMHVPEPTQTAQILFTSGSTGQPKGVVLSHRSQITMLENVCQGTGSALFEGRRGIVAAPLFHMNGLFFSTGVIAHGGAVVMMPRFEATSFISAIDKYRVNVITGIPTMIVLMCRASEALAKADLSCVEMVYIGSAPVTKAIVDMARAMMPGARILNSYGTTETGGALFGNHPQGLERPVLSVGYPMRHVELRLVDGEDSSSGILEVKAPSNMTCYLNLPEKTAERVKDGWISTGDRFRIDERGFYFFDGRADDMFVCNGENVYPAPLEAILETAPGIAQVCVVPVEDVQRGAIPIAYVVAKPGASVTEGGLKDHALARAPAYMHPRRIFLVDSLPLSATGKVNRQQLIANATAALRI